MIDPVLAQIFTTTIKFGVCGTVVALCMRYFGRATPGPRLDQAAAIGFLIGAGWGAFFGVFEALLVR